MSDRVLLFACLASMLASCATLRGTNALSWPLPDPAQAPFVSKTQDIEISLDGRAAHFLAVLERQKDAVLMVGLSPLGQRLAMVRWSRQGLSATVAPEAAPYFAPRQVLDDLCFALWPPASLEAALKSSPYHADFKPASRTLWRADRRVLVVEFDAGAHGSLLVLRRPGQSEEIRVRDVPQGDRP